MEYTKREYVRTLRVKFARYIGLEVTFNIFLSPKSIDTSYRRKQHPRESDLSRHRRIKRVATVANDDDVLRVSVPRREAYLWRIARRDSAVPPRLYMPTHA